MKISKSKLRQIIKEELSRVSEGDSADRKWASNPRNPDFEGDESSLGNPEVPETALNSPSEAGRQWEAKEEIYAALVNYAADKMRQSFEFGHDVATVEGEVKDDVLRLVNAALEEAAQIEL